MPNIPKNTICIWYDREAEEAARFYASVFPDSEVKAVYRGDVPEVVERVS
jgi:predicted 3-demethylubiquinone-9 3-methyltransferase (glyoxalase superfamily)